jgi:hypothetical protein
VASECGWNDLKRSNIGQERRLAVEAILTTNWRKCW